MKKYYSLKSYFWYLKQFRFRLIGVFLSFAFSDACLAVIPIFIGRLVGELSTNPIDTGAVWFNAGILIGCSFLHSVTWHGTEILYMKFLNPLTFRYETEMARHVLNKPYPFFVGKFTGKIASYITTLGKEIHIFLDRVMYNYSQGIVKMVAITSILFSVNVVTGAIFLIGILLMLLIGRKSIGNSIRYESKFTDIESTKNGKIIDIMSNYINVKSFQKESSEHAALKSEQEHVIDAATRSFAWAIFFWTTMSTIVRMLIWPITIAINVYFYLEGMITLAELTTLLSTIMLFSNQIWEFIWYISQFNLMAARTEEAHRYLFGTQVVHALRYPPEPSEHTPVTFEKSLVLKELKFSYPDQPDQAVLKNIDLTIKKGEKVGIVGKSGSGKTTLVKILLGYYEINDDSIQLDGKVVKNKELLDVVSYVPQDATLFNRTISENIAYAVDQGVKRAHVVESAKRALADEFITKIPKGYDAIVGERGVKLSTGQRQRIAIARAMLQDKPLLILDEATSALDSENEVLVQKSLENLWDERTVISIAHRLSTLRKMDRILVFDNGRIVEQGTMKELLKKKGAFYDLWNHQVNGMILE